LSSSLRFEGASAPAARGVTCPERTFAQGQPKWIKATTARNAAKGSTVTSRLYPKSELKMPDLTRWPVSDSQRGQARTDEAHGKERARPGSKRNGIFILLVNPFDLAGMCGPANSSI
jgi:hypothetical protein